MTFWKRSKVSAKPAIIKPDLAVILVQQRMSQISVDLKSALEKLDLIIVKLSDEKKREVRRNVR